MTMPASLAEGRPYEHQTVMAAEVVRFIEPRPGGVYLDVTAGAGGHSAALLEACPTARIVALDRDPLAIEAARARLEPHSARALVEKARFSEAERVLREAGIGLLDGLIADLGVSSPQLSDPERGMSFRLEGPLDMRMDPSSGETALELIMSLTQDELADVIYELGEERRSRRVARCIKQALAQHELSTTLDLRRAVVRAVGPHRVGGIDPATRTFQALRMAVNSELIELKALLGMAPKLLAPGAPAVVISFHSLEDRIVKHSFAERQIWTRLTPKPLIPSSVEQENNPRARSAKLRAARLVEPSVQALP